MKRRNLIFVRCPGTSQSLASSPTACHGLKDSYVAAGGTFPELEPPGRILSQASQRKCLAIDEPNSCWWDGQLLDGNGVNELAMHLDLFEEHLQVDLVPQIQVLLDPLDHPVT